METAKDTEVFSRGLIKSKKRVADHGEVFTPSWLIEAMLDLTEESDRVDARFLEPACGDGNFLIRILQRKLAIVELTYAKAAHERRYLALIAAMSIYGIELLEDNILECRRRMLKTFAEYLMIGPSDEFYRAASQVLVRNLVHGDALKMHTTHGRPIVFSEWEFLGHGKFRRRDFRFDLLAQASATDRNSLAPIAVVQSMTVREIGAAARSSEKRMTL